MSMSIYKSVGIAAGKLRKAALVICCIMLLTLNVSAASNNEIKLEADGSEATLELYFPQAAAEETASMQVSVSVKANLDGVDLEFIPDSGLASKIVESRYHSETGILNIYLAGTEALFPSSGSVTVGKVKVTGNNSASATVEVVKDSVKFVRSGELVSPDNDTDYPASVTITASGQSSSGTPTPTPSYPNHSTGNYFPNISVSTDYDKSNDRNDTDGIRKPVPNYSDTESNVDIDDDEYDYAALEEEDTAGENLNPPDTSSLSEALSRADDYRETDYTESSYDDLKDAVNKAEELISDPNATQDEIDEALLDIENAIGMLRPKNDIPSGAAGYGGNDTNMDSGISGVYGDNTDDSGEDREYGQGEQSSDRDDSGHGSNSNNGAQTSPNGNIVNASNDVQSADLFTENEGGGKSIVWMIVLAVIAAAAAAVIAVVLKKSGKKKSADGNH